MNYIHQRNGQNSATKMEILSKLGRFWTTRLEKYRGDMIDWLVVDMQSGMGIHRLLGILDDFYEEFQWWDHAMDDLWRFQRAFWGKAPLGNRCWRWKFHPCTNTIQLCTYIIIHIIDSRCLKHYTHTSHIILSIHSWTSTHTLSQGNPFQDFLALRLCGNNQEFGHPFGDFFDRRVFFSGWLIENLWATPMIHNQQDQQGTQR